MLLVVVDQAGIGRRGDHAVVRPAEVDRPGVTVEHARDRALRTRRRERLDPIERVERVAQEEAARRLDRTALAPVLEAPVRLELWRPRELEVEMRRAACRAGRTRQHDAKNVRGSHVIDEAAKVKKLLGGGRGVPRADVGRRAARVATARLERLHLGVSPEEVAAKGVEVVGAGLDPREQRVESGDVDTRRVVAGFERLDERRPRAGEGVEHATAGA